MIPSTTKKLYKILIGLTFCFYPIWFYIVFFVFGRFLPLNIIPPFYVAILGGTLISEYFRMENRSWKPDPQIYDHNGKKV